MKILLIFVAFFFSPCIINLSANCQKKDIDTISKLVKTRDGYTQIHLRNYFTSSDSNNYQKEQFIYEFESPDQSPIYDDSNLRNIPVSRNPSAALITQDNQFVFVRCHLSNTVEIINISTGGIVKSFTIPSPISMVLSNDGTQLIVASLTATSQPPNPPDDDCDWVVFDPSYSILTIIDVATQEILHVFTINLGYIYQIYKSSNNDIIYLKGDNQIVEFDLGNNYITRRWPSSIQMSGANIDNKNSRIFFTTLSNDSLKVINLIDGNIYSTPFYSNGDTADWSFLIFLDTLSNRVFVGGKQDPYQETLVFDAISLNKLYTIDSCVPIFVLACPNLGSIYLSIETYCRQIRLS